MRLTKQEAFNKIWERAKTKKLAEQDGKCKYRTAYGDACFIGCLIPDELYDPAFEVGPSAITALMTKHKVLRDLFHGLPDDFLTRAQGMHDLQDPEDWEDQLRDLAVYYGLEIPK